MSIGVTLRIGIFLVGSYGILRLSLASLTQPRSHGFYRFFAFEALLALFLINVPAWLNHPFSLPQVFSWILMTASAILAVLGFNTLHKRGKPSTSIESTTVLVSSGIYRYIRHPLYASLLYLGWGVFLKQTSFVPAALTVAASILLFLTAWVEERENISRFGPDYAGYMLRTKRFVPFIF